jgi:hypothetical protein
VCVCVCVCVCAKLLHDLLLVNKPSISNADDN